VIYNNLISKAPVRICHAGEDLDWLGYKCCCSAVNLQTMVYNNNYGKPHNSIYFDKIWSVIKQRFNLNLVTPKFTVSTEAPIASGLSTSSSLTIALIKACLYYAGLNRISKRELINIAYEIEYEISKGGGMDQLTIVTQGTLLMQGCQVGVPKVINRTSWPDEFELIILNVKQSKSITSHIKIVRKQVEENCQKLRTYISAVDMLAEEAFFSIKTKNINKLSFALNESHALMRDIQMMSTEKIELVRELAIKSGCEGVKLTGSGGGGCLFSIVPKEEKKIIISQLIKKRRDDLLFDILTPKII